ncbi:hypothetical protein ABT127_11100 [Streptomyces sp. NPDC001904]|uniref:hypothetical protein n=1 Tax=Streptomyces sp. NPDC001904 TaxID=3154531 RepID=UPI00332BBE6C
MDAALTAACFLLLIAGAAYVIHRLDTQRAERALLRTHRGEPPGRRGLTEAGEGAVPPLPAQPPVVPADRHDHRDGGRGRFPARRRRDRTTHKQAR